MADDKVTIPFQGGPRDGEEVTLPNDKVRKRIDVMGFQAGVPSGRYEIRYVWQDEQGPSVPDLPWSEQVKSG